MLTTQHAAPIKHAAPMQQTKQTNNTQEDRNTERQRKKFLTLVVGGRSFSLCRRRSQTHQHNTTRRENERERDPCQRNNAVITIISGNQKQPQEALDCCRLSNLPFTRNDSFTSFTQHAVVCHLSNRGKQPLSLLVKNKTLPTTTLTARSLAPRRRKFLEISSLFVFDRTEAKYYCIFSVKNTALSHHPLARPTAKIPGIFVTLCTHTYTQTHKHQQQHSSSWLTPPLPFVLMDIILHQSYIKQTNLSWPSLYRTHSKRAQQQSSSTVPSHI